MKKIVAVGLLTGLVFIAVLVAAILLPREPVYQGKTISRWVTELPVGQRPNAFGMIDRETPARKVLRDIGTNAIPYLTRAMTRAEEPFFTNLKIKLWLHSSFLQSHFARLAYPLEIRREAASMLHETLSKNPQSTP